jgi:hypothetical protein
MLFDTHELLIPWTISCLAFVSNIFFCSLDALSSDLVIPRMKTICPWAKLIVMLRNPTERAYSQYQMCVDPAGTPEQLKVGKICISMCFARPLA